MAPSRGRFIALLAFALVWSGRQCAALCFEPPPSACGHCHIPCGPTSAPCQAQLVDADVPQASMTTAAAAPTMNVMDSPVASAAEFLLEPCADVLRQAVIPQPPGPAVPSCVLRI